MAVPLVAAAAVFSLREMDHDRHAVAAASGGATSQENRSPPRSTGEPTVRPPYGGGAPPLRAGDRGAEVLAVQAALATIGLDPGAPDGTFGARTRRAVVTFQAGHGLRPDGVVGTETMNAVADALDAAADGDGERVRAGLRDAVRAGRLRSDEAIADRAVLARSLNGERSAGIGSVALIAGALSDVADQARDYDANRARALFAILDVNTDVAGATGRRPFRPPASIQDDDGVVYRYFPAHGLQFHPLASFAQLNVDVRHHRAGAARRLADAMVARGVVEGGSLLWEYYFDFGGPERWTSGFAQAVAADSLAGAAGLLHDRRLAQAARSAFAAVPSAYVIHAGGGVWIREYSFNELLILNAQLQTIVSLSDYAQASGDSDARHVVAQLEVAARALLPRFDLGCWSRYALGGRAATPTYHAYHIRLLRRLSTLTHDPRWAAAADRWDRGLRGVGTCSPT